MVWVAAWAALAWWALLWVPWRPWSTVERLEAEPAVAASLAGVTVLMPARNEAPVIGRSLAALAAQGARLRVIVIDDDSTDGTADVARGVTGLDLTVLTPPALPPGWTGKLWALEQGRQAVTTPYILLLDADIAVAPGLVATLLAKAQAEDLVLVSLMAAPAMKGFWDRWWMPVFIYFFKLLYPFRLANRPAARLAAAAGGCLLTATDALAEIGGFAALRDAVIDDCALAARIKAWRHGGTWLGLTHSATMLRANTFAGVWRMVARTAFTQLRYSYLLLGACALVMVVVFMGPLIAVVHGGPAPRLLGVLALVAMAASYVPTARFYRQPLLAIPGLPLAGLAFLLMTFTSALWYARGVRSRWKGRDYSRESGRG